MLKKQARNKLSQSKMLMSPLSHSHPAIFLHFALSPYPNCPVDFFLFSFSFLITSPLGYNAKWAQ